MNSETYERKKKFVSDLNQLIASLPYQGNLEISYHTTQDKYAFCDDMYTREYVWIRYSGGWGVVINVAGNNEVSIGREICAYLAGQEPMGVILDRQREYELIYKFREEEANEQRDRNQG